MRLRFSAIALLFLLTLPAFAAQQPFEIRVVDSATGRGVPLVELRTTAKTLHVTDNAGRIAFLEPGLMDQRVFFHISSHGYRMARDQFGYRGAAIDIAPGGKANIEIERVNIAERLYRITGAGLYRDTILLGHEAPLENPLLNGNVTGQDSVQATPYNGRIYWFWGDTDQPRYPLGNFRTSGATSPLPDDADLPRDIGINLTYFTGENGFVRPMAPLPSGNGNLMWISGLLTTRDTEGRERLVAHYQQLRGLGEPTGQGLLVFDDKAGQFEILREMGLEERWRRPIGQATRYQEQGRAYWLFVRPLPLVRVPDTFEAVQDRDQYEAFTCLVPGARFAKAESELERDSEGNLVWAWKRDTEPVGQEQERELIAAGLMTGKEARFQMVDADSGNPVRIQRSTVNWNGHLRAWILIGTQHGGESSFLGETWFARAESPAGPWRRARRIVTHDKYSFYNPAHHAFLDEEGGRYIYFEATYTNQFTGGTPPTPYYDYNQILYRLDLDDPRLEIAP
jgi:hypothetical protein